jgi:hypothetical protein
MGHENFRICIGLWTKAHNQIPTTTKHAVHQLQSLQLGHKLRLWWRSLPINPFVPFLLVLAIAMLCVHLRVCLMHGEVPDSLCFIVTTRTRGRAGLPRSTLVVTDSVTNPTRNPHTRATWFPGESYSPTRSALAPPRTPLLAMWASPLGPILLKYKCIA